MEIEKMLKMYNDENLSLVDIAKIEKVSKSTIQRFFKKCNYSYDKVSNKYIKNVSCETIDIENSASCETMKKEKTSTSSYTIPHSIYRALKFKAVDEDKNNNDIIAEALKAYIEDKYFNI